MDEKIDRYELQSQLGRGGMATVYHAYDPRFKRYVAVKVLPREFLHDETFHSRFEREAMTIANLEHLAIVPVHDFGEYEGQPYLVMRYMPGGSLQDRIKRGPMSLVETCHVIEQLAPALDKAHDQGVIHRDLKPGNILFDEDGNAYLSDFGIAKISEATAQLTGSGIVGTPAYMAPEVAEVTELTPAVDIYALGVILYQMLTGQQPFQAATPMGVLLAHINNPVPDIRAFRPDLPQAVQHILAQAMAKDPAERYPCAADLAADLNQAVRTPGDESVPLQPVYETMPDEPAAPPSEALTMDGYDLMPQSKTAKRARGQPVMLLALIILCVAVVSLGLGGLALAGVFGGEQSLEEEIAEQEAATGSPAESINAPLAVTFTPNPDSDLAYALAETGVSSNDDWTPHIEKFDGVEMALVPAGCFMMGSEDGNSDELPVHEVCFDEPFWIDVYEVTNEQYGGANKDCTDWSSESDQPRICIDWFDSVAHCESRGARLPTEAEWEYAARGPDSLIFPWGNTFDGSLVNFCDKNCVHDWADNNIDDGYKHTAPVGSYPGGVSWVGAYDLSGNIWEWVNSLYMDYPYDPDDGREVDGDSDSSSNRVLRDGSWGDDSSLVRAAYRGRNTPVNSRDNGGFRCARSYAPPNAIPPDQPTPTATPESAEDRAFAGVAANSDWNPYFQEFDGVKMALVPAGCFMMGSDTDSSRRPVHEQCFDEPFWIDVYEVTNAQFREFGGEAESDSSSTEDNLPRDQITWAEALAFCERRGARLPTEVEWEYAARGPDGLMYPWGNAFDCSRGNFDDEAAVHDTDTVPGGPDCDGAAMTTTVGSFPYGVSWVGAFDMSGNISEWTSSWYALYPYDPLDGREAQNDPGGYEYRVLRGGSWAHDSIDHLNNTYRFTTDPTIPSVFDGLRCARSYGD